MFFAKQLSLQDFQQKWLQQTAKTTNKNNQTQEEPLKPYYYDLEDGSRSRKPTLSRQIILVRDIMGQIHAYSVLFNQIFFSRVTSCWVGSMENRWD